MNNLSMEAEDSSDSMLEFASNNDVDGFKLLMERNSCSMNEAGVWYSRGKGWKHVVKDYRTPLMVGATYGNVDVMKVILSCREVDVNLSCGVQNTTALHCAASSGSLNSFDVVKLLLSAGADTNCVDGNGHRPVDVVVAHPKVPGMKAAVEELLLVAVSPKVYLSIPDIKNSMYATDEFRMFSFKVRPCSRAYSHDWTECPFVHPGENARRRDPRTFHYSCVPCPEFRKGTCRRGDLCEYAHGVFECWLHPAQYRTRLCKDGTTCNRRICFFAHRTDELRPLYANNAPPSLNMLLEFDAQQQLMNERRPSNLEDRSSVVESPTHKSALMNQFQHLSPGRMAAHLRLVSLSSRDILGSPVSPWWGSSDWCVNEEPRFEVGNNAEEPDLSWVQSLVKEESPPEMKAARSVPAGGGERETHSVLGRANATCLV